MFSHHTRHRRLAQWYLNPILIWVIGLLAASGNAFADSVTLAWNKVSAASGYRVYYGTASGKYTSNKDAGNAASATVTGLADGTRYYFAVKAYAGSLTSPYSSEVSTMVGALVAAYGFDETSGTRALDSSGKGNHGTLLNATRSTTAKFGQALSFNGSNSLVTVGDTSSLDLTNGMTLMAWVRPTDWASSWKSLIVKERSGGLAYALNANSDASKPNNSLRIGSSDQNLSAGNHLPTNAWTHLAATYDGTTQRLFVNGVQVGSRSPTQTGTINVSANPLRIGGNTVLAGRYFKGLIDEVRVYNRALIQEEIAAIRDQRIVK